MITNSSHGRVLRAHCVPGSVLASSYAFSIGYHRPPCRKHWCWFWQGRKLGAPPSPQGCGAVWCAGHCHARGLWSWPSRSHQAYWHCPQPAHWYSWSPKSRCQDAHTWGAGHSLVCPWDGGLPALVLGHTHSGEKPPDLQSLTFSQSSLLPASKELLDGLKLDITSENIFLYHKAPYSYQGQLGNYDPGPCFPKWCHLLVIVTPCFLLWEQSWGCQGGNVKKGEQGDIKSRAKMCMHLLCRSW